MNNTELFKKIANKRKVKITNEIVEFTHKQIPWSVTNESMEEIPYEFIIQEDPNNVY